jgi:3-hydroxyisobutyrate dehydrogenase-like beta-hydroxyacid dehydrogenase
MTHIAFLGTGLLGGALAEAAAKRGGDSIVVWNRTLEKARALETFGARVAPTPADAARGAQRIHLILKDDAVVEEVIAALRPGLDASAIIVDHTTTQPALTAARAKRLATEGVRYLHCPVFIGPPAARAGKGTIMACGPRALFDEVREPLSKMAERLEYLGERPDLAAVFKLCGNAYIIGTSGIVADMLAVGASGGVPSLDVLRVLEFVDPVAIATMRGKKMAARDATPTFELFMARKDVRLMLETAADRSLAVLPSVAARMDALIAEGHGQDDLAVIGKDSVR